MECEHKNTKVKLVSWATDCKGQHEQGFKRMVCCADCGVVIKPLPSSRI